MRQEDYLEEVGGGVIFATIYGVNWTAPEQPVALYQEDGLQILLWSYTPAFDETVPIVQSGSGIGAMIMGVESHLLPHGNYLVIERSFGLGEASRYSLSTENAALAAALDLAYPHILGRRYFDGIVKTPGAYVYMPEGVDSVWSGPMAEADEIASAFSGVLQHLSSCEQADQERFKLVARWYTRGLDSSNPVDRLLFFYTCLEIYPATGTSDVPGAVSRFVADLVDVSDWRQIKDQIGVGRIAGQRARVVHDGLAFVDNSTDPDFILRVRQAQRLARVSLLVLGGLDPTAAIDDLLGLSAVS